MNSVLAVANSTLSNPEPETNLSDFAIGFTPISPPEYLQCFSEGGIIQIRSDSPYDILIKGQQRRRLNSICNRINFHSSSELPHSMVENTPIRAIWANLVTYVEQRDRDEKDLERIGAMVRIERWSCLDQSNTDCFGFAFTRVYNLPEPPPSSFPSNFVFWSYLKGLGFKPIDPLEARDYDLVIYGNILEGEEREMLPKHVGVIHGPWIVSKFGASSVFEHSIEAVPSRYGSTVRVYKRPKHISFNRFAYES